MPQVMLNSVFLDFPVYGLSSKSFRRKIFRRAAGAGLLHEKRRVMVEALKNISCQFERGDRVAVIGRNGSGKSTLLRVLAGIYVPQRGDVIVKGRISTLFSTSLGIHQDASGYENIRTCGYLLGMSAKQVRDKMDEIAEFTELGEYLSMPIRTYSAGMKTRLQFAIATTAIDPEILLLDEIIGAGDSEFCTKATIRINEMSNTSSVLFIALHNMEFLRRLCNKAIWLNSGELMAVGDFEDVVEQRLEWEQKQQQ